MGVDYIREEQYEVPDNIVDSEQGAVIAVDVGCEFTKASYWSKEDNCSSLIPLSDNKSIPTAIAYSGRYDYCIGTKAIDRLTVSPKQVIRYFPFLLNHTLDEELIEKYKSLVSCEFITGSEQLFKWHIIVNNENIKLTLMDVYCDFLAVVKTQCETFLQEAVRTMILTVNEITPSLRSFFSSIEKRLNIHIQLVTLTSSFCLSYGFFDPNITKNLLLLDFGWDSVRIANVEHSNVFRVKSETTIPFLCGYSLFGSLYKALLSSYANSVVERIESNYSHRNRIHMNLYNTMNSTKRLLHLKRADSSFKVDNTTVSVSISSKLFKRIIEQQIHEFDTLFHSWLTQNQLDVASFDDVLVAGGVANCNLVYDYLQTTFPTTYFPDLLSIYNPENNMNETVVVSGAAIQVFFLFVFNVSCAGWMGIGKEAMQSNLLIDLLPYDLCIETEKGFEVVIPKGVTIPSRRTVEIEIDKDQRELVVDVYREKTGETEESKDSEDSEESEESEETKEFINLGSFHFKLNNVNPDHSTSVGVTVTISESGRISATCSGSYEPDVNVGK